MTPKMIKYQASKIATTYRVMPGQTKVRIPAASAMIPPTMNSQRPLRTQLAAASSVTPPYRKATPTSAVTAARLPTR